MRKFLIALIAVATLGAGTAFAQSGYWAGLSTGYPFGVTLHFGMEDVFAPDLDVRFNLQSQFSGGTVQGTSYSVFSVVVGADALYNLALDADPNLDVYAGGGLTLGFSSGRVANSNIGLGGFLWDIHGLFGAEYRFASTWGVFGEAQLGYGAVTGAASDGVNVVSQTHHGLTPAFRIGVNYHF